MKKKFVHAFNTVIINTYVILRYYKRHFLNEMSNKAKMVDFRPRNQRNQSKIAIIV